MEQKEGIKRMILKFKKINKSINNILLKVGSVVNVTKLQKPNALKARLDQRDARC